MEAKIALLLNAMAGYDRGDAARIHHFLKVWALAATIGKSEHLDDSLQLILEAAALVHDIGIHVSEKKYGSSQGRYQEIEGPSEARSLLARIPGFSSEEVDRICFLVGHHHTYSDIQGLDYQILVEADFLVNIYEDRLSSDAALGRVGNCWMLCMAPILGKWLVLMIVAMGDADETCVILSENPMKSRNFAFQYHNQNQPAI